MIEMRNSISFPFPFFALLNPAIKSIFSSILPTECVVIRNDKLNEHPATMAFCILDSFFPTKLAYKKTHLVFVSWFSAAFVFCLWQYNAIDFGHNHKLRA